MAEEFGYEKLEVWQLGMRLTDHVYELTRNFPQSELYGLTSQMRRPAISVSCNIAEGYGRGSNPAFAAFAKISRGSLYELRTQLEVALRQGFVSEEVNSNLRSESVLLSRKLDAFIRTLEKRTANR